MKLFFVYVEDEVMGEAEAVFDESGKMLACWSNNDACWRNEYFAPFMAKIGVTCISREPTKNEIKLMKKSFSSQ